MLEARGRWMQVLLNTALAAVCVVCYLLLLILYLKPSSYQIESILRPDRGIIKPAAVVGLLSVILAALTSTLVTRCVEHSLWIRLVSGLSAGRPEPFVLARNDGLTVGEVRRLALWSTSAFQRLSYLGELDNGPDKRSMLLRPTGPLLIAAAIAVGPVLLTGISQSIATTTTTQDIPRLVDPWKSRLDVGNMKWLGRWVRDNPATMAALVAMNNFTAPVAPLCDNIIDPKRQTCSVEARTLSIRAECSGTKLPDTDGLGLYDNRNITNMFCVDQGTHSELCVKLETGTYGAFASGRFPCAGGSGKPCSFLDENERDVLSNVGPVHIHPFQSELAEFQAIDGSVTLGYKSVTELSILYTEYRKSPYDFNISNYGQNEIERNLLAYYPLGANAGNKAESVARQIEANCDMATLQGFARWPNASNVVVTYTETVPVFVHDPLVLLVLLVPFIATVLGTWGRWRVGSLDGEVIGYGPIAIARLGPVEGLVSGLGPTDKRSRDIEGRRRVWGWRQDFVTQDGTVFRGAGLQTSEPSILQQPLLRDEQRRQQQGEERDKRPEQVYRVYQQQLPQMRHHSSTSF